MWFGGGISSWDRYPCSTGGPHPPVEPKELVQESALKSRAANEKIWSGDARGILIGETDNEVGPLRREVVAVFK
jgi:hypothetical protein